MQLFPHDLFTEDDGTLLIAAPVRAGVLGPMSNEDGVGLGLNAQTCEAEATVDLHYRGRKAPYDIRHGLPGVYHHD